ncbi:MAG TPA: cysteine dioxygenase family protein [Bacillales bacterium]|nr:cysteine dioxygenase family protein [Bacillales bacterium]
MNKLTEFIEEMTAVVEKYKNAKERMTEAERLISKLICDASWLPADKRVPCPDHYARYPLYHDPQDRFEIIALAWQPGQQTPIHDHDGTWGVEGVVAGRMKVTNYLQIGKVSDYVVKLRHAGTLTINEQSTGQLLPPADCHVLEAEGDETVITIHVYGKKLCHFKIFEPLEEQETYLAHSHEVAYSANS